MITYVIILIAVILVGIPVIILVNRSPKLRIPFQIFFGLIIVVLGYLLVLNINKPIKFEKAVDARYSATVQKLKDIRDIQVAYKDKYGKYTGSFDTLVSFVKTDSFAIESLAEKVGSTWNQDEMTKAEALKKGILVKSTSYEKVSDSLWKAKPYDVEKIRFVPYTDEKVEFVLGAGELETASKVKVKVFESYTTYKELFEGLDEQLVVNYIDNKTKYGGFEGIKVGSLTETTNNAGNWEQ